MRVSLFTVKLGKEKTESERKEESALAFIRRNLSSDPLPLGLVASFAPAPIWFRVASFLSLLSLFIHFSSFPLLYYWIER